MVHEGLNWQRDLQALLEEAHGANAASIAARMAAYSSDKCDVYRLMDEREKLMAAAQQVSCQFTLMTFAECSRDFYVTHVTM